MSEIDQQFIEYVVKSLVGKPDAVSIERRIDEKGVLLELTVDPEDLGRVIGKRGATAQSLRTLLRALGTKNDARYNLKIIDNGVGADAHTNQPAPIVPQPPNVSDDQATPSTSIDEPLTEDTRSTDEAAIKHDEVTHDAHKEGEASDRLKQTRKELADLDDLDV